MNVALRKPSMTREAFLAWAERQNERYEFDGAEPVAMTGGMIAHSLICQNIYAALRSRLRGGGCRTLGPDAGVATVGGAVRYPDALVTCTPLTGTDRLVPGVLVVFEVLSPTSERVDTVDKLREYRAIASIRRYVILHSGGAGLVVYARQDGEDDWTATTRIAGEVLPIPEVGIEVPVAEFYEDTGLMDAAPGVGA